MGTKNLGTDAFGKPLKKPTKETIESLLNYKPKPKEKPKLKGFTYVPQLNLYVADEISMFNNSWYECKQKLKNKNSKMLTPAEFWIYYDYCFKKRMDIVRNSFQNPEIKEWLDALIIFQYLAIGSNINSNNQYITISSNVRSNNHHEGTIYINAVQRKTGTFNRENVNCETGLPFVIKERGEFMYHAPSFRVEEWISFYRFGPHFSFESFPYQNSNWKGVREAKIKV